MIFFLSCYFSICHCNFFSSLFYPTLKFTFWNEHLENLSLPAVTQCFSRKQHKLFALTTQINQLYLLHYCYFQFCSFLLLHKSVCYRNYLKCQVSGRGSLLYFGKSSMMVGRILQLKLVSAWGLLTWLLPGKTHLCSSGTLFTEVLYLSLLTTYPLRHLLTIHHASFQALRLHRNKFCLSPRHWARKDACLYMHHVI